MSFNRLTVKDSVVFYTVEYYSPVKIKEIMNFIGKCIKLGKKNHPDVFKDKEKTVQYVVTYKWRVTVKSMISKTQSID